jgi:hypothetical protein
MHPLLGYFASKAMFRLFATEDFSRIAPNPDTLKVEFDNCGAPLLTFPPLSGQDEATCAVRF